ncbi:MULTISPECIES: response regulator [Pseudoalteromonas]|uniref:Two-component system response regulator n=1 Tax=Pseudoalteromonas amylolytica TaxID=1859457 RepID=A0A1S1MQI9_9GAMM|nr:MULTISPECIES: HD domain-containing phosphohydrolase [Pseudoalteromonas]OHU86941.1 two-component system response regulator [Pseudoalteromonas sp. JW3]OHU88350.1 two-component system response regulator [Pseudoalteromonas amylolytica]
MPFSCPILCIDDEPSNLALIHQALKDTYKLVFARNGEEGLEAALKHGPSLILSDVEMPGMSGFEFAVRLKEIPELEHIPIIFVTSLDREYDEQKGFDVGGVDYISKPISTVILRARVKTHLSLIRASKLEASQRAAIFMLADAGHYNDSDTGVHIWRMAAYSRLIATHLGWSENSAELLELAAPMHDTGKIGIPDAILKKPGKLDVNEWEIMKRHSQIGYDILSRSEDPVFKLAAQIALYHHEKWDGSGYPKGLKGHDIPEAARIVADVFDALTMKRPYKDPWPLDKVCSTLQEMALNHLDKEIVALFLSLIPEVLEIKEKWDLEELRLSGGGDKEVC